MSKAERTTVPPGTLVFGVMFSDGSCGGWNRDRADTEAALPDLRAIGLRPVALIRLRTTETLVERR